MIDSYVFDSPPEKSTLRKAARSASLQYRENVRDEYAGCASIQEPLAASPQLRVFRHAPAISRTPIQRAVPLPDLQATCAISAKL